MTEPATPTPDEADRLWDPDRRCGSCTGRGMHGICAEVIKGYVTPEHQACSKHNYKACQRPKDDDTALDLTTRTMRTFDSGATRDSCDDKPDYEGFLSPRVIEAFGQYMHGHRKQVDGNLRDSDNWQKGMTKDIYIKSLWRHFFALWKAHRGLGGDIEDALGGILFNAQGYWHEHIKESE